ncbi:unnamed protein product [Linum trigynum]|uniref:YTH domain-containing family protein n=3 Tax=Linum trigynum TaxID=586398 RepID=A0AAV2FHL6_9ROSI
MLKFGFICLSRAWSLGMEMYNVSGNANTETYLIQQSGFDPVLTSPVFEQFEAMYNGGAPEYVHQGMYYPTASNYSWYCTGFEAPGEWEDPHMIFGVDGPEVQYAGAQTENLPYVCYTPSYGYAQSPYNPYNPYIPGAMMGVDGSYVGYTMPPYQDSLSSAGYVPVLVQGDVSSSNLVDPLPDAGVVYANSGQGGRRHGSSSASFSRNPSKSFGNQTNSLARPASEGPRSNNGSSKYSLVHDNVSSGSYQTAATRVLQSRNASGPMQPIDSTTKVKYIPQRNQPKHAPPVNNGLSEFGANSHGRTYMDKNRSNVHVGRTLNDADGGHDALGEQNRGPRTTKSKTQLAVKAYTAKVGDSNAEGNIIISTDQYNRDDFQVDYTCAKFFVIKSYSEDDVHKSIKYNVWSSTPHGNKKLQSAYEDAQKMAAEKASSCPIFLFFSVNASGQFCGVAEMIGPVNFRKDMDFWQQDKWSGSFPVKWHMIKDVQNGSFRHIILENNENKPVTNSRDTQEVMIKQGLEMLKIFKRQVVDTSLLDDFTYYEHRQRIMQEEKTRFTVKRFGTPFLAASLDPTLKLNSLPGIFPSKYDKPASEEARAQSGTEKIAAISESTTVRSHPSDLAVAEVDNGAVAATALKIGSLSINPMKPQSIAKPVPTVSAAGGKAATVVTVGTVPVKVNGFAASSGVLTFGTIPPDSRALQGGKGGCVSKKNAV